MNPLTDNRIKAPPLYQRRRLGRWLKEWATEQILQKAFPAPTPTELPTPGHPTPRNAGGLEADSSTRPCVGEVRLLQPILSDSPAQRPLYVAILAEQKNDAFLVAPFARFAEPAVPGEWLTGLTALPLRVLCVWNARAVQSRLLKRSWPAMRLTPRTVRQALDLHQNLRNGEPLISIADKDLGPPLQHPLDPRHTYLEQESSWMEENLGLPEPAAASSPSFPYQQTASTLPMAAEKRARYRSSRKPRRRGPADPR